MYRKYLFIIISLQKKFIDTIPLMNNFLLDEEEESGIASGAATPGNRVF